MVFLGLGAQIGCLGLGFSVDGVWSLWCVALWVLWVGALYIKITDNPGKKVVPESGPDILPIMTNC